MLKKFILFISTLFLVSSSFAQIEITWETLSDVRYTDKYNEEEDDYFLFPHFGFKVKSLEGEEVYLKGYILEIDPDVGYYLLSSNPYASCFFCGNAGPETVVELSFDKRQRNLRMDDYVTIKGKLRLNDEDVYQCNYIFDEPELFDPPAFFNSDY